MDIRNEVKAADKDFEKKKFVVRNAADVQRAKLEKLMKNPEKPVIIPDGPKERDFSNAIPSFVRNVMGSSAGAGSGEFHVYRHLRRKEYARQKHIQEKSRAEQLDEEFHQRLEQNKRETEEKTAKKRAKRQKKKAKQKATKGKKPRKEVEQDQSETEEEDDEEDDGEVREERKEEEHSEQCGQVERREENVLPNDPSEVKQSEVEKTQPTENEEKRNAGEKEEMENTQVTERSSDGECAEAEEQ